ncbi:MAG TPA: AraC family transcriptional regulator [Arachidicoccus sp.]
MKVEYEIIKTDKDSSFRLLHHKKIHISDFIWQYHYHPEYEIVYVKEGSGTRHVGNHLSRYHSGDLVLIGSNLPHSGFGLHAADPHEEIVLQVRKEILPIGLTEMEAVSLLLDRAKFGIAFSQKTQTSIGNALNKMLSQSPVQKYLSMLEIFYELATAQDYLLLNENIIQSSSINKHKARLQKIFTYVENSFAQEVDIEKVARIAGLSVPSFCNFFKKTTQITFTSFVNNYRIQQACMLLQQDKTIAEVCFECGFNNVTYFNKVFKSVMAKTPTDFIREINAV